MSVFDINVKNISVPDIKIDASDPSNLSDRVVPEKESRRRWLNYAKANGFEKEMLLLFAKYDKLMRNCTNDQERRDISKLGCVEFYRLLGGGGELYVDGQLVMKDS
jgi:hypothetical protein